MAEVEVRKPSLGSLWTMQAGYTWVLRCLGLGRLAHFRGPGSWLWIPTSTVEQGLTHWCRLCVVRTSDRCRFETVADHIRWPQVFLFSLTELLPSLAGLLSTTAFLTLCRSPPPILCIWCANGPLFIIFYFMLWFGVISTELFLGPCENPLALSFLGTPGLVTRLRMVWACCVTFFKKALTPLQRRRDIWDTRQVS